MPAFPGGVKWMEYDRPVLSDGITRFVVGRRTRWVVVAAWLVLAALLAPLASKLPDITQEEYSRPDGSQSQAVGETLRERSDAGDATPLVLVYRRDGGLTRADRARIAADAEEADRLPLVGRTAPPFLGATAAQVSRDDSTAFTVLELLPGKVRETTDTITGVRELAGSGEGLESHLTGSTALLNDLTNIIQEADARLLLTTGLLVLILLLAIYRSPLLALIPLVVVGISFACASGIIYLLAERGMPVSSNATSLLLVLMFGVGTDYCLLIANRYVGELRRSENHRDALVRALPATAPAIVASGATVIAALLTLLASVLSLNRSFAPVNAIGVGTVLIASLTLLPALLSLAGRRAFWPRASRVAHTETREAREGAWVRVGRRILRRPGRALAISIAALLLCSLGLLGFRTNADILAQFRADTDGTRGYEALASAFSPGAVAPLTVLAERRDGPFTDADVQKVQSVLGQEPGVGAVSEVQGRSRDGRVAQLSLTLEGDPYSNEALDRVDALRERAETLEPLHVILGDGAAARLDYREAAKRDILVIAPLALLAIFLTLVILLRAVLAPLYLLATIVLSFFASLGLATLLFRLLGQESVDPELPLIAFVFLIALGSDYTIFFMHRVREEAVEHGTRAGALRALGATGSVITGAGMILAGTFAVLTVVPFWFLVELGLVVALGILIDTFVVRTIVVPAIVELVGERSWWPFPSPSRTQHAETSVP